MMKTSVRLTEGEYSELIKLFKKSGVSWKVFTSRLIKLGLGKIKKG